LAGAAVAVRRLALRAADSASLVVLLTSKDARRSEALPVAARVELSTHANGIRGEVQRHRGGWPSGFHISLNSTINKSTK
jgi:hypothetical protein